MPSCGLLGVVFSHAALRRALRYDALRGTTSVTKRQKLICRHHMGVTGHFLWVAETVSRKMVTIMKIRPSFITTT